MANGILQRQPVWNKGVIIPGYDPRVWRRDAYGNNIRFQDYGNRQSEYGWEIDHVIPVSQSGTDDLQNLRPLQWEANAARQ